MPRLLIVDDEPDIREIIRRYAELEGYETMEASDGFEALSLCREKDFDVAVMDIMMPGMDGYEATRAIRLSEKADAADIPIIALTANAFNEDAKAAHDAGMNAHLPKPLDFNKLKNILARIKKNGTVSP